MDTRMLPHNFDGAFLTDGGLETTLIFHDHIELPEFAAFILLDRENGKEALRAYYRRYLEIAAELGCGFILESPTWRASTDWGEKLGYGKQELDRANRDAIALMHELRASAPKTVHPIIVSGCVGPRGDGYRPDQIMSPEEAEQYHLPQVTAFREAGAEHVTAMTMTHAGEAAGVARAASRVGLPVAISFTVETDGRLPTGQPLGEAIQEVDDVTNRAAAYFMINCAHPSHFEHVLDPNAPWMERLRGLRANASRRSHRELNEAPDLDAGDPVELGRSYVDLVRRFPRLNVLGGCCGTDHRHVARMADAIKKS